MRPSELKALIVARFKAGIKRPLLVESSPGLGKTQIAAQAATELGVAFKAIHAPLLQPEDYGFPVITADRKDVDFIVSRSKFPLAGTDCPETGVFLIDELSQADNSAQKILTNLIHEREIHGQRLKPGWIIVATGNRTTDRAGANRILSHLGNRVTRVELEASIDDWTQWALNNAVKPEVISFLRFRTELMNGFDPQAECNPTPRAWVDGVSAALGIVPPELEFPVFKGDVGEGAAAEFLGFLKICRQLPNPDTILLNPSKAPVPKDPATLYALCGSLAHRSTPDNFGRILIYVERMPPEFTVLYVRDALARCPDIQNSADFIKAASGPLAKILT
jgi:hypothetical protein